MTDLAELPLVPLLLALLLGGAVGLERQWHGRPAGLRTHVLVCLSSTMLILISRGVGAEGSGSGEAARVVFDPNRMGAGIVTGIGFLGAATVLRSGDLLRGLTTAACIWFVAGLGIALGNGDYVLSTAATVLVLFTLTVLPRFTDGLITPVVYRRLVLHSTRADGEALLEETRTILRAEKIRTLDVATSHDNETGRMELVLHVSLVNELQSPRLTHRLAGLEGVTSAHWRLITAQR